MKGLEEFFGKLKKGDGEGLNEELKETSNILKKLFKLEKAEAKAASIERGEKDKQRRRTMRKKKRKAFDLQNPFANQKKEEEKEEKDKGFPWGKILLALGLGGGLLAMFKDEIIEFLGNWAKDRIAEIGEFLKNGALTLGKAITDFAWDKFAMRQVREQKMIEDIKAVDGKTIEEKIATLEQEREGLGVFQQGRKDEITNQLHYLRSGEMPEHDWRDGRFRKRAGGGLGSEELLIGDVSSAIRETDGADTEKLAALREIKGLAEERAVANDKVFELQQRLIHEKDEKVKAVLIKQLASYSETLKAKTLEIAEKLGEKEGILQLLKERRNERLRRLGQPVPNSDDAASPTQLQKGGVAGKRKKKPTVEEAQRYLATTDAVDMVQKRQEGGLVLFQGHGDVPIGHAAPGTDGPGTSIAGKFKPTAEQYFVDKVNAATEKLAKKEGVDIRYQRPTGRYASARQTGANWQMIDAIRAKGGSAVEIHFDAYGMDNGRMIKGFRGLLADNYPVKSEIDKALQDKFGTHPSSGKGYGSFMLELDHLGKAQANINNYARMLVDAVKGVKGGENAGAETDDTTKAELAAAKANVDKLRDNLLNEKDPKKRLKLIDEIVKHDNRIREIEDEIKREIESRGGPSVPEQEQREKDEENRAPQDKKDLFTMMEGMGPAFANITQYTKVLLGGIAESLGMDLSMLLGSYEDNVAAGSGNDEAVGPTGVDDQGTNSFSGASTSGTAKGVKVAKALMADLGLTADQASGIVGNFLYESAGMKPDIREGGPYSGGSYSWEAGRTAVPAGYGWAQWSFDRHDKFVREHLGGFGGPNGVSTRKATDADNYAFLLKEFRTTEKLEGRTDGRPDMPKLDVVQTTSWFRKQWERAGVPADNKRIGEAQAVREKLQKGGMVGGKLRTQPEAAMGASTPGARPASAAISAPTYERPTVELSGGSQNVSKLNVNVTHVRMQEANEAYRTKYKAQAQRPIVIINDAGGGQSAPMPRVPKPSAPPMSAGGGLNMVQASDALHRINSGARF